MRRNSQFILFLSCLLAVVLTGCGGGKSLTGLKTASGKTSGKGKATVKLTWPKRSKSTSRLIPQAANSVKVALFLNSTPVTSTVLTRPALDAPSTSTYDFTELAPGTYSVTSTAYPSTDALSGVAQAKVTAPLTIVTDQLTSLPLTMDSAVTSLVVSGTPAANVGATTSLTATALDATGSTVLVGGTIAFTSSATAVATVDPATGVVTGLAAGTTTITATYSEGGVPVRTGTLGVTISVAHYTYVADFINNRIEKFDSSGAYLSQFGSNGTGNGQLSHPYALVLDSQGNVYVVDNGNNRIEKFDSSGAYLSQFGSNGSGNGQFAYPYRLALDSLGNLYVADGLNHRIQKFDSSGAYLSQFGTYGSGNGQFAYPYGLALDSLGNIYVADFNNNRVQKFDSSGNYLSQFGTPGSGNGQLTGPTALAVQ